MAARVAVALHGFGVDVDVRVHACEAVVALARSDDGVMCAQRCQLTPLIKRLLLDPTDSAIRLKAAEAVHALAKNFRGQALLCQRDIECHLACKRQRKREWYERLSFTSSEGTTEWRRMWRGSITTSASGRRTRTSFCRPIGSCRWWTGTSARVVGRR